MINGGRLTTADGSGSFLVHYGLGCMFDDDQVVLSDFLPTHSANFDHDGDVDGADFVQWHGDLGIKARPMPTTTVPNHSDES